MACIVKHGGDYLISVKGNQPTLRQSAQQDFCGEASWQEHEKTRGRCVHRSAWVVEAPEQARTHWAGLAQLLVIERAGTRAGVRFCERHVFATSLRAPVATLAALVRKHWSIENRLHWTKDVLMHEDRSGVRSCSGAHVLSLLRSLLMTLCGQWRLGTWTEAKVRVGNRIGAMMRLLKRRS